MSAPMEIVAAPLTLYVATVGTTFPSVTAAPGNSWTKLGTSGDQNYDESGVKVTHGQSISMFTPAGGTAPRKAFRTAESLMIEVTLVDLTPEQYAKIMNDASVTTGTHDKSFDILQGLDVARFALLAKGVSAVDNSLSAQYEVPIAIVDGEPSPVYTKGTPAGLLVRFQALAHDTLGFGKLRHQTSAS